MTTTRNRNSKAKTAKRKPPSTPWFIQGIRDLTAVAQGSRFENVVEPDPGIDPVSKKIESFRQFDSVIENQPRFQSPIQTSMKSEIQTLRISKKLAFVWWKTWKTRITARKKVENYNG